MSDAGAATKPRRRPAIYRCEVCREYACFGIGGDYKRGVPGKWYCRDHYPAPPEGDEALYNRLKGVAT